MTPFLKSRCYGTHVPLSLVTMCTHTLYILVSSLVLTVVSLTENGVFMDKETGVQLNHVWYSNVQQAILFFVTRRETLLYNIILLS